MKKFALVDPDMLKMLQEEHLKNQHMAEYKVVDPRLNAMSRIDTSISDILKEDKLPEETKANLVTNQLGKFLHYKNRVQFPHETKWNESNQKNVTKGLTGGDIAKTVPIKFRKKAEQLAEFLKSSGQVSWTDTGRLVLQGQEVQNTNIVDLINDALRQRKTFTPPGWENFAKELRRLNAPKELVGNVKYWESIPRKIPVKTPLQRRRLVTSG